MQQVCAMTCSPNQSKFLNVTEVKENKENVTYINAIEYFITNEFLEGTFQSCKQVSVPSTGQLALDIMCGSWGAAKCTAMRWFEYMGTASDSNAFVPFTIKFRNSTAKIVDGFTPLNPNVIPCNQAANVS